MFSHSTTDSRYTIIKPFFYGHPGNLVCQIRECDLEISVRAMNPMPADKFGIQLMTASVAGRHIGDCEFYGSNIQVRKDNQTNTFDILVNDSPVIHSSNSGKRPR